MSMKKHYDSLSVKLMQWMRKVASLFLVSTLRAVAFRVFLFVSVVELGRS